jgi:hypothetical protein
MEPGIHFAASTCVILAVLCFTTGAFLSRQPRQLPIRNGQGTAADHLRFTVLAGTAFSLTGAALIIRTLL